MRLCVITDEISDDVAHALKVAESLDIGAAEIRILAGRNIVEHSPETWRRVAGLLSAGGFACPVLDSPFLKETPVPGDEDYRGVDWSTFARAIEAAGVLGADVVRVFSGRRRPAGAGRQANGRVPGGLDPAIAGWLGEVLAEAADRAERAGLDIAVEIEHVCTIATAAEAATMDGDWGYVLDPGNESYLTGSAADTGLVAELAPRIRHVHVKDVSPPRSWVRVDTGMVGWPAQLAALRDIGYAGHLSMETHYSAAPAGLETATRESVAALRGLAAAAGIELR